MPICFPGKCKDVLLPRVRLNVDTPFRRLKLKSFECALLSEDLDLIDDLVAAVVAVSTWRTL